MIKHKIKYYGKKVWNIIPLMLDIVGCVGAIVIIIALLALFTTVSTCGKDDTTDNTTISIDTTSKEYLEGFSEGYFTGFSETIEYLSNNDYLKDTVKVDIKYFLKDCNDKINKIDSITIKYE